MSNLEKVKEFMRAAGQETPEWPTYSTPENRISRIKMLFEELLEMSQAAGVDIWVKAGEYGISVDEENLCFESNGNVDFVEMLDGAIDLDYILKGTILSLGVDPEPLFNAIHQNNMTKFVDGWRDNSGKWRKGPSYKPVDLKPLIDAQVAGEPPWVEYEQREPEIQIFDGNYKDKNGNVYYFTSGPRDNMIWRLIDGRISGGLPKSKFYKYFTPTEAA